MKIKFKITIICLIAFFSGLNLSACCGQETDEKTDKTGSGAALEDALKNYEAYRQKEQEQVAKTINLRLNQITDDWIKQAKKNKENLLGTRLEQNWEKLALSFPISPARYEYYLRGYRYNVIKNDVIKSESITSPYKAIASIKEELYVEKYHSPDISDTTPYFFTITTVYNLNFEYRQDKLELIDTDSKIVNIENSVPEKIRKPGI